MSRNVRITETLLRDAHQSLLATRLKIKDMLEVAELLDSAGFYSLEAWGGATFDSCLRYLDEDPWERLRLLRKHIPNTKLQMLLRGQNLLGYRQYPDDVVKEFIRKSVDNGIDIVRVFDALNDTRNLEQAIIATKEAGGHCQAAVVYTTSPVHTVEGYLEIAKDVVEMGADSLVIKDMAGILTPAVAKTLIPILKEHVEVPIQVHSHYTSGLASMTYLVSVESGADGIDTALSPLSLGTSQPPTETMVAALQGMGYAVDVDLPILSEVTSKMKSILQDYQKPSISVDTQVLVSQIPGGMLSNLRAQLEQQKMDHKFDEIVEEVPKVRKDLGYPPLVTPMSQIVGVQSLLNVITGKRYSVKSKEIKDYVQGMYGRPPVEIEPEIRALISEEEPLSKRPADFLPPVLDKFREAIKDSMVQEEDVLTYILFPDIAKRFFEKRSAVSAN